MTAYSSVFKTISAAALTLMLSSSFANGTKINELVFFGDSLTDNGNLYNHDFGLLPKSPPYYRGRFSDGITWAEHLADHYYNTYYTSSQNYATGGATTFFHNPFAGFMPFVVGEEIDDYYVRDLLKDKSHTLFFFWSGGNDYLPGSKQVDADTTSVINKTMEDINSLVNAGAKNIFIFNLPDLGGTPQAIMDNKVQNLHDLTVMHNMKLGLAITDYQQKHPDVDLHIFDAYALFHQLVNDIDGFNKQYGTHFSNVNSACWQGGYALQASANTTANISYQLQRSSNSQQAKELAPQIAARISSTPELMEAYQVSQSYAAGAHPCADPDSYVFWDHIHPTKIVHEVMAKQVEQEVDKYYHFK